jgi:TPR repeat protein
MAQGTRYNPYDNSYDSNYPSYEDRYAEPVDLDSLSSQLRSPHPSRSVATREEYLPEDSVPLFLAGSDEDPRSSKFARAPRKGSRLLKTGAFAAAALVATFVAVKNPFAVFANATASLIGSADVRTASAPVAPPAAPPRQAAAAAVASTPAMVAGPTLATTAAPSRDEIALALKTAHQNLAPAETPQPTTTVAAATPTATAPAAATTPAAASPAAPPARRIDADELANLMARAKSLLASGDISPARLLLERAAEAQEASAALMLAQTYDPTVLGTQDIRNITPDPALARSWYQRAAQLGSADAQRRLSQLQ